MLQHILSRSAQSSQSGLLWRTFSSLAEDSHRQSVLPSIRLSLLAPLSLFPSSSFHLNLRVVISSLFVVFLFSQRIIQCEHLKRLFSYHHDIPSVILMPETGFRLIILTELNITGTSVCEWMFSFTTGFICFTRGINSHSVTTADELCDLTCPRRVQLNLGVGFFFIICPNQPAHPARAPEQTSVPCQ